MHLTDLMKKDKKLFESKQVIAEDLGNLNIIDPKFRKLFQRNTYSHNDKKYPLVGKGNVGQESPIESVQFSKPSEASRLIFDNDRKDIVGIILLANDVQVLAITKETEASYRNPEGFKILLDGKFYNSIEKNIERKKKISKMLKGWEYSNFLDLESSEISMSSSKTIVNAIYKTLNDEGFKVSALIIKVDTERLEKQHLRQKSQRDVISSSGEEIRGGKFKDDAKRALKNRLEKFKADKAEQFGTPQEFMQGVIQKGFLDKVNIDGFPYYLRRDELRLSQISNPKSGWGSPANYIEYKLDESHSEKLDNLRKQGSELRAQVRNNPELEQKFEKFEEKMPPREIRIIMGMQGGAIVPTDIQVKDRAYY